MSATREPRRVDRRRYRDERSRPLEDERHNRRRSPRRSLRRDDRRTSFEVHRRYQRQLTERRAIVSEMIKRTTPHKYERERERAKHENRSTSKDHETHNRARTRDRSKAKTGQIRSDSDSDSLNKCIIDIPLPKGPNCCLVDMELSSTEDCLLSSSETSPKRVMSVNDRLEMEFGLTMGSPPRKKKSPKNHEHVPLVNYSEVAFQSDVPQPTPFPHAVTMTELRKDKFIPLPNFTPMFPAWQGSLMPIKPFSIALPNNLASKYSAPKFTGFRVQRPLVINVPTVSSALLAHQNLPSSTLLKPEISTPIDEPYIDLHSTSASNTDGEVCNTPTLCQMISKPLEYSNTISLDPNPQFASPIKSLSPVVIPVSNSKPIEDVILFTPVSDGDLNKPHFQKNPVEIAKTIEGKKETASPSFEAILKATKEADVKNQHDLQKNSTEIAKTPEGTKETVSPSYETEKATRKADVQNKPNLQKNPMEIAKTPEGKEEAASPSLEAILKAAKEADEKNKKDREILKRDREIREKETEQILLKKSKIIAKLPKDGSVPLYAKPISKRTLKTVPPSTMLKPLTVNCKKKGFIEKRKPIPAKKKTAVFSGGVYPGHGSPVKTTHKPKPTKKLNKSSFSIDLSLPPPPPPPLPPSPPPGTPPSHLILSALLNPAPGHMWAPPKHPLPPYNPQAASQSEVMMRLGAYHRSMLAARKKDHDNRTDHTGHMTFATRYQEHINHRNLRYVFPLANEYFWT